MNIIYLNFSLMVGGIERLLVDIVNTAAQDEKNNIYLCIINDQYDYSLVNSISKKVNVIFLNRPVSGKKFKYIIEFAKLVRKNNIDVIHCQNENSVKFSLISKIVKSKVKVFTTVHDTNIYLNLKAYEVLLDRFICKKIIAISDAVKEDILKRKVPKEKVIKIYNAIDLGKFKEPIDKNKIYRSNIVIGNVSRVIPEKKGQDILIKAISKLKERKYNIQCLFAGDALVEQLNYLNNLCNEYKVEENIEFLGNVDDIPNFLSSIDIFVMPSRYEGFGIALIEAMAKGIPCIASNIDGPKEIIKDNKYGLLFESENYLDLADKIEYRINNMKIENEDKIQRYLEQNYNIKLMINNLYQVYKDSIRILD